ncbi:non-specific lipid transfer protein GPI-anchored 10 [Argentina anserina]|uniref:non-specific lipid transfer protein GPI-anchored 10 n=1 Tax=Argentina anserina TaxID=57926 RepID=UPI00217626E2|nr:non-specific lipid transfer protein GPI-anchored 10 [Potentilla anserina]
MASLPLAISSLTLLFLTSLFPSPTVSKNLNSSVPTVAQCASRLIPLATCAPFVQGTAPSPGQTCCDNLNLVYSQQPSCLCLLLNSTTLSSFPINTTLALQLPALCTIPVDASACSGAQVPPSSPTSQVSFGANNTSPPTNSTVAASPIVKAPPPRTGPGVGFPKSASTSLKLSAGAYAVSVIMAGFLMPEVLL